MSIILNCKSFLFCLKLYLCSLSQAYNKKNIETYCISNKYTFRISFQGVSNKSYLILRILLYFVQL